MCQQCKFELSFEANIDSGGFKSCVQLTQRKKALSSTTSRAFFRSGKCKDDCPSFLNNHVHILFFNYYRCKTNWTKLLRTLVSLPRRSHMYHDDCVCRFYHQWHWILYLHHPFCKLKVCIGYTWKRVISSKSVTSHSLAYHVIKL